NKQRVLRYNGRNPHPLKQGLTAAPSAARRGAALKSTRSGGGSGLGGLAAERAAGAQTASSCPSGATEAGAARRAAPRAAERTPKIDIGTRQRTTGCQAIDRARGSAQAAPRRDLTRRRVERAAAA